MSRAEAAANAVEQHCDETVTATDAFNDGVNTVVGVTTASGANYIVKFGTCDPAAVAAEPFIMEAAASFGAPVPEVHGGGRHDGTPYFVATWIDGTQPAYPMELSAEEVGKYAVDIGGVLATLQSGAVPTGRLAGSDSGLVGSHDDCSTFYQEHLVTFAEDVKKNYGGLGSDAVRLAHWGTPPSVEEARLCPLDLHTHNLLYDGNSLRGVIDFERYYGGHPAWGVAVTKRALTTNRSADVAERITDAFERGYTEVQPLPTTHPLFELGALLREMRAAHMWWEDAASHRERYARDMDAIEEAIRQR